MSNVFTVPLHGQIYYDSIRERCNNLIDLNIWDGIEKNQLRKWLNNFSTDEERYFAACVLDCLIFRSEQQTESLFFQLFYKEIPNLVRRKKLPVDTNLIARLKQVTDPKVRLVSVMRQEDSPIKSASIVARILKRAHQLNQNYIIKPIDIKTAFDSGVREFIFVDDFLGTGDQFNGVLHQVRQEFSYEALLTQCCVIYAPLVAHYKGVKEIQDYCPYIHIIQAELLDDSNSLFNQCFDDGNNGVTTARAFYLDMLRKKGFNLDDDREFGYGNLELTFAFNHAIPDNSLGILHFSENNWNPLINR
ncbi:phosphoribosyltransferase-like protein [Chryseolinea lacunae]|uniref:PRTase-CE domain-containing protein n=1 Tax=Chryseolinea lacunae TaxID=2801331 RepID=A0ABS1L2M3_9BACT|nr:hypothetical protein [Chryseolinea lacunae]MBL0745966.1 hypothetical protein [Chryseolinea lacunae]